MAEKWILASPGKWRKNGLENGKKWLENPFLIHFRTIFLFSGPFSPIFHVRPKSIFRPFLSPFGLEPEMDLCEAHGITTPEIKAVAVIGHGDEWVLWEFLLVL